MSAAGRRAVTHCQEHTDVPATWERHVHQASTCGPQTARTWIQYVNCAVLGALQQMVNNVDNSWQSTSWSRQSSLSGTNYCSVSSMAPLISGVAGLSKSSRSKANKSNIWCKNCSMWVTLNNNWDNKHVVPCLCVVTEVDLFPNVAFTSLDMSQSSVATHLRCGGIFSGSIITHFLLILIVK